MSRSRRCPGWTDRFEAERQCRQRQEVGSGDVLAGAKAAGLKRRGGDIQEGVGEYREQNTEYWKPIIQYRIAHTDPSQLISISFHKTAFTETGDLGNFRFE